MNKEEQQAFEAGEKAIKRLLAEEKRMKAKLEKLQKTKITCIKILLSDEYCEEILKKEVSE
jgi:tRNA splicing ligase